MADMDLDAVNPLTLSLDDVIKLNKHRNQQESLNESKRSIAIEKSTKNGSVCDEDETSTFNRSNGNRLFRNDLQAQRKSVHERLGWKKSYNQDKALRAIRNAHIFKNRIQNRHLNLDPSSVMPPPLSVSVLRKHNNQNKGNFSIRGNLNRAASVSSMSLHSVGHKTTRHSMQKCLNSEILTMMKDMLRGASKEIELECDDGEPQFIGDLSGLQNYKVIPSTSPVPTYLRFKMNDENSS